VPIDRKLVTLLTPVLPAANVDIDPPKPFKEQSISQPTDNPEKVGHHLIPHRAQHHRRPDQPVRSAAEGGHAARQKLRSLFHRPRAANERVITN